VGSRKAAQTALVTAINTNHTNVTQAVTEQNTKYTTVNHVQLING